MTEIPAAETLAEQTAMVSGTIASGLRPAAPSRPPSPDQAVVVGGSGSARGLRPGGGERDERRGGVRRGNGKGRESSLARRCELTERDIRIFGFLEVNGAATMGQLWGMFFRVGWKAEVRDYVFLKRIVVPRGVFSRAHRRLKKLADYGYLERRRWYEHMVFTLTAKGHWQLVKRGVNQLGKHWKNGPREHEMRHTLLLGALVYFVRGYFGFQVKTEREIRRDIWFEIHKAKAERLYRPKEAIPDLYLSSKYRTLGFELELSLKSRARYFDYWDHIKCHRDIEDPDWLYVAGTSAIQKHLLKVAEKKIGARGIFVCDLESFSSNPDTAEFKNYHGWYFKLYDLHGDIFHLQGVPPEFRRDWEMQRAQEREEQERR